MGIAVILVRPQMGENIGAAARVMLNFGMKDLRVVAPRDGWPNEKAALMAAGAEEVLEKARVFESVAEAVADLRLVYATTGRSRYMVKDVVAPEEIELGDGAGIIFGPERTGLDNEDLTFADKIVSIPVNPEFPSLNLAQSVAVICYALSRIPAGRAAQREAATKEEVLGLFQHLEAELEARDFFKARDKKPGMIINIRNMISRMEPTGQDVRTLRGIVRCLVGQR